MGENIWIASQNEEMRELVLFRVEPHLLRYFVHSLPQHIALDAFGEVADETALVETLLKMGYQEREVTHHLITRMLVAFAAEPKARQS